jgi:membrane protein implicated in regulation of membrane protease activity
VNANLKNGQLPGNSPFANILVVVFGIIAIAVSFIIGVVAFVALAAAVLVFGAIIGIRIWWLGVKSRKGTAPQKARNRGEHAVSNTVIEGEYQVIAGKKDQQNRPDS